MHFALSYMLFIFSISVFVCIIFPEPFQNKLNVPLPLKILHCVFPMSRTFSYITTMQLPLLRNLVLTLYLYLIYLPFFDPIIVPITFKITFIDFFWLLKQYCWKSEEYKKMGRKLKINCISTVLTISITIMNIFF